MITCNNIGYFGRLGNQLFQFASTLGIGRKLGYEIKFPLENSSEAKEEYFKDNVVRHVLFDVPKVFNLPSELLASREELNTIGTIEERYFHFDSEMFTIPDNVNLFGYYQTEKYFKHVEEELRSILTFRETIQATATNLFPKVENETVAIHVRRGDYVVQQHNHPVCSPEYYQAALAEFEDRNYNFIIFSDDIEYCKDLFGSSDNLHYLYNNDPYVDLCLMSMCDHNIIANSSFSWWGAWLNKNPSKKVIAPTEWFGVAYPPTHLLDLIPTNWIRK